MSQFLTSEQLNKLPTPRLLALYRKRFRWVRRSMAYLTDFGSYPEHLEDTDDPEVEFALNLQGYVDRMKTILDARENVKRS